MGESVFGIKSGLRFRFCQVAQRQVVRHCATAVPQPEKRQLLVRNRH